MESKGESEIVAEEILTAAIEYSNSLSFVSKIDEFKTKNCHVFSRLAESKSPEDCEQDPEFFSIFLEYQKLIDSLFEDFAKRNGSSSAMLYENCRDAGRISSYCITLYHIISYCITSHCIILYYSGREVLSNLLRRRK